jgi:hypothetical protein
MVTNEDGLRRIDTSVKEIIHIKVKRWYLYMVNYHTETKND